MYDTFINCNVRCSLKGKISKWLTMVLPCFDWLQQLETHTCGKCQANVNFEQSFLTKGAKSILIN